MIYKGQHYQTDVVPHALSLGLIIMRAQAEAMPPDQVDPTFLHRLFYVDHLCLAAASMVALVNIFPGIFAQILRIFPPNRLDMRTSCAVITLCAAMSLFLSEDTQPVQWKWLGRAMGGLAVLIAAPPVLANVAGIPPVILQMLDRNQVVLREGSLRFSSTAFLLAGVAVLLVPATKSVLGYVADGLSVLLAFIVLTLVLEFLFEWSGMPAVPMSRVISTPALWCLALVTLVVACRRSEHGFLSILWGHGTGSRIARMLTPVLLLLPLVREISRAHLLKTGLFPPAYAGAALASTGTVLGLTLLMLLARLLNRMQEKIQGLVLRDELTGLHSVRGFYLLAEQAFLYSRRMQEPFGVLFLDMDNLKTINDRLGHGAGSVSLVETAKLLMSTFRDTDIIGRVGGDEFVVAGQFDRHNLEMAMERLREAVARKNHAAEHRFSISLSMGCAVTSDFAHESLRNLVKQADEAMYEEKHAKKQRHALTTDALVVL